MLGKVAVKVMSLQCSCQVLPVSAYTPSRPIVRHSTVCAGYTFVQKEQYTNQSCLVVYGSSIHRTREYGLLLMGDVRSHRNSYVRVDQSAKYQNWSLDTPMIACLLTHG